MLEIILTLVGVAISAGVLAAIVVEVFSFTLDLIEEFFTSDSNLLEDPDKLAISVKQRLNNGDYNVVNCFYDKAKETVVEVEKKPKMQLIEAKKLDKESEEYFGDKDMIVLQ